MGRPSESRRRLTAFVGYLTMANMDGRWMPGGSWAGGFALALAMVACQPAGGDSVGQDAGGPVPADASDATSTLPDGGSDATVDGGTDGVPTAHIATTCGPDVIHCEQSAELGLRDGRGYGRGVALIDVDGDGWTDIWRSESGSPTEDHELRSGLYRNLADGTFEPWDVGIAEEHLDMNWAGIWGDIDGDGAPDLVLLNGGYEGKRPCALYRNDLEGSGQFVDVTEEAGLITEPEAWWSGAFGDFDGDGDLDLVIAATGLGVRTPGALHLYRNDGRGRFEEVSEEMGIPQPVGDVKNPIWIDYDRDGDLDLIVSRTVPYVLYDDQAGLFENRGAEGFVRVDPSVFPGEPVASANEFAFAVVVADFDQDGWDDVYLGRWDRQDYLLRNLGDGTFESLGTEIGIETDLNTMGLGVGDINGNGYPDLFIGPGDPRTDTPPVVWCNVGTELRFERCEDDFEAAVPLSRWHGVAFGDLNRDFKTDVVVNLGGWATHDRNTGDETDDWLMLFINHSDQVENAVRVHLVGSLSPRMPIGAHMRLDGSRPLYRTVHSAQGFQSINDPWMVLPMGTLEQANLHVHWPSGWKETFEVHAGTEMELVEGTGQPNTEDLL
jgi:hypothetical protein